jgi:phosphatidylglycerol:prolipoprotein diacylglycerol transferase
VHALSCGRDLVRPLRYQPSARQPRKKMIPYFVQPSLSLGPLTIHAFGLMVAAAVIVGSEIVRRRAVKKALDPAIAHRLVGWIVVGGFIGAHLVDRFVYFPKDTWEDPWSILRVWAGLSSFGGFLGALASLVLFLRVNPLRGLTWWYVDVIAYAFPFAWVLGRVGCFLAFDHPGSPTTFFLGQADADGVVRHNLGLDEAIYSAVIALVFSRLGRTRQRPGVFIGLLTLLYAPFRFGLDFLRQVDIRYVGLTPGQYGAAALVVCGIVILSASREAVLGAAQ